MDELQSIAASVSAAAHGRGHTVAAAESVTGGSIAVALAAAPDASQWFCGSIVTYRTSMKQDVLGVTSDKVISHDCARQMAEGALQLTGADLVVSVTGVGGPDPEEGQPPGTVIICAGSTQRLRLFDHAFDGPPEEVVRLATLHALRHLVGAALDFRRSA